MSMRHSARAGGPRRRRPRPLSTVMGLAVAVLAAATSLTGCSDADSSASSDPADLIGKKYVSTHVAGPEIPGGGPLVLGFTEGNVSANAGCNGHGGAVSFADGRMTVGDLLGTMMACPPPRDGADRWLTDLFEKPLAWRVNGSELVLSRDGRRVVLTERENRPVIGTRWRVTSLVKNEGVSSSVLLERRKPFFLIDGNGRLTGHDGCNAMRGTAKVDGDTVDFDAVATTRMACDAETGEIEKTILAALRGQTTVKVDGDDMSLTNVADGNLGLRLTAVDEG